MSENWSDVVIPAVVFLFSVLATFWLRRRAYYYLNMWAKETRWQGHSILVNATRNPSAIWALIISACLALAVSSVSSKWEDPITKGLWTVFVLSLILCAFNLSGKLIQFYGEFKAYERILVLSQNVARIAIIVCALLMLLDIWGAPVTPILLFMTVVFLVAVLALRDIFPDLFAWLHLSTTGQIKVGDYIKLETGEEGYVTIMDWRNIQVKALDEGTVLIPNRRLIHSSVINYGRTLKRAKEPFHFYSRTNLKELTGLSARNIQELADVMKLVPDSVIYYHTHQFLEEHHYLTPEPANDFAIWVRNALGDEVLGEKLAAIDTFEFPTLGALRERLVNIVEEHLTIEAQQHRNGHRDVPEGREFHFIKSVSAILPTPYVAHDLREFIEALPKISLSSLYFHIFESRLRLSRGLNDFSVWLEDNLNESELAEQIARLDPYTYTLEGLRSTLIQLIEKRIK